MDIQQQVERYQMNDRLSVSLYRKLRADDPYKAKGRSAFSGLTEQDYPRHEPLGVPFFLQNWHHSFPQELMDQFKHMQSNFATGLLPSIMRAWMSIDSDLYLWNFENNRDIAYYDAINNTILHVDIVVPKPGFSYPSLHSILIVATTVDILLLALSFQDSSGHILPPDVTDLKNATIMMVGGAPLFRLPLDGLITTDLCPTGDGRIFFSADDSLYELEYFEKGWFGTGGTCRKTNHSKRLINYLVPVLQIFYAKDSIFQLAIDDSRHLLWVLMKSGCIQLFDLGPDGRSIQKFGALYREQVEHLARESCNVSEEFFAEIVQISPVSVWHSANVNLVATSSKGVRIYITCLAVPVHEDETSPELLRPSALRMLHFRFPPDCPTLSLHSLNVYSTHLTQDCILMATPGTEPDSSLLLAQSSACFALGPHFTEYAGQQRLRGNVWEIVHARPRMAVVQQQQGAKAMQSRSDEEGERLPLCIEQHLSPVERFYVITSKGIYVFDHCSPLELFRRILKQFGNDSKQFQALSATISPVELCTMALVVLASQSSGDIGLRDQALRVFFSHGGEPRLAFGGGDHFQEYGPRPSTSADGYMNGTLHNASGIFAPKTPLRTSTPQAATNGQAMAGYTNGNGHTPQHPITPGGLPLDGDQSIVAGAKLVNSPRHEALFTLFGRLVRPIWRRRLCGSRGTNNVYSLLTREEVEQVGQQLNSLKRAIEEHQLITAPSLHHFGHQQRHSPAGSNEANLVEQERQALHKLRSLIGTCCELLALWGVLLEHELQAIFVQLAPDVQRCLLAWTLDDLARGKSDVCADLIGALIRFYIGDDASTTAVSDRLRQLCPSLFTLDDACVVRATESIYRVKAAAQPRPGEVREAVAQFRKSIQKLNLVQTCDLLLQVLHFEGIVDLTLTRARRDDPNDLALVAYKKHIGSMDGVVNEAINRRAEAYNCLLELLQLLHTLAISQGSQLATLNLGGNIFPSAPFVRARLSPAQAQLERDRVLAGVLGSEDELACVHVFQWMLANGLAEQLLSKNGGSKYFESFLFHEIEEGKGGGGNAYMELLWKYYEKNQNYLEAAKILAEMAYKPTSRTAINQRIQYLTNALMCIQSATETRTNTELKQDIQDKLDVAQIQLRTKALLESDPNQQQPGPGTEARGVLDALNYRLCDLTDIYKYAKAFNLHEIKLAVLQCAGRYEPELVQNVWRDLLEKELRPFQLSRPVLESTQKNLSTLLLRLRRRYASSPQFVPLEFILAHLLMFCFRHTAPLQWLLDICRGAEIPYRKLLSIASEQYRIEDPFWRQKPPAFRYMLELALSVVERCRLEEAPRLSSSERKVLKNTCLEFLSALQLDMQTNPGLASGAGMGGQRGGNSVVERLELLNAQIEQIK